MQAKYLLDSNTVRQLQNPNDDVEQILSAADMVLTDEQVNKHGSYGLALWADGQAARMFAGSYFGFLAPNRRTFVP